ncbi:multidrug efflux pump subunit AcrA (membrane-fusion protein) [Virgibacillus natechei]|uniref:Multidrug efflux pump subunit AcrA (Membrane-fusion protein) n=1 Tax=Virgibacillus natechei TaxID=1216297 RepID=A0ABS4IM83_9BACI|nr:efflux RND transporter periplasmic adaptor subunit [Virgibacillus natechei]MBP1971675.1 multidrug efflux pump subunit AcrA (membrane-fusion protein) [Virgibacillus natechei]UZD12565.1 efflux RND transporter periplasmic adaptor subunit [Virgibacillus natechei]
MRKLLISLTVILMMAFLAACMEEEDENGNESADENGEAAETLVETAEASEGDLVIERSIYGRTSPASTNPVMVENPGEIDTIEVETGDQVEEDDLIATITTAAGNQDITAAAAGEITNLEANEGDMISNEDPLAIIADFDTMSVAFSVTANVQSLFSIEDSLTTMVNDNEYETEITAVNKMPDDTGLYPVEGTLDNEDGNLLAGMIARVAVPENRVEDTVIVPTQAIVEEDDEAYVYVVNDDMEAVQTTVTIQESQTDETAIESDDMQEGDEVVVDGHMVLTDGGVVDVVEGE